MSQTHNIEAKLKAREANPDVSLEERAKQREVSTGSSSCQGRCWCLQSWAKSGQSLQAVAASVAAAGAQHSAGWCRSNVPAVLVAPALLRLNSPVPAHTRVLTSNVLQASNVCAG